MTNDIDQSQPSLETSITEEFTKVTLVATLPIGWVPLVIAFSISFIEKLYHSRRQMINGSLVPKSLRYQTNGK